MKISLCMNAIIWNRLSSKHESDFLLIFYFPRLCFLLWILLILCLSIFLLNKVSLNLLNSVAINTPFAILDSLHSIFFEEYIFDFNWTKLLDYFSFWIVSHFTNNFFISLIKKVWIFWIVTKVKQMFVLKKFFINIWFYFISNTVSVNNNSVSKCFLIKL